MRIVTAAICALEISLFTSLLIIFCVPHDIKTENGLIEYVRNPEKGTNCKKSV